MNKLFAILLLVLLSLPIKVAAVDNTSIENSLPKINTLDEDILPTQQNILVQNSNYKKPISKKTIAKKFLIAMGGVATSSFAIFFILTLYNKIRENVKNPVKTLENEISLETPQNLNDAIKIFLKKTNW